MRYWLTNAAYELGKHPFDETNLVGANYTAVTMVAIVGAIMDHMAWPADRWRLDPMVQANAGQQGYYGQRFEFRHNPVPPGEKTATCDIHIMTLGMSDESQAIHVRLTSTVEPPKTKNFRFRLTDTIAGKTLSELNVDVSDDKSLAAFMRDSSKVVFDYLKSRSSPGVAAIDELIASSILR
jgi:hypothetical protein